MSEDYYKRLAELDSHTWYLRAKELLHPLEVELVEEIFNSMKFFQNEAPTPTVLHVAAGSYMGGFGRYLLETLSQLVVGVHGRTINTFKIMEGKPQPYDRTVYVNQVVDLHAKLADVVLDFVVRIYTENGYAGSPKDQGNPAENDRQADINRSKEIFSEVVRRLEPGSN